MDARLIIWDYSAAPNNWMNGQWIYIDLCVCVCALSYYDKQTYRVSLSVDSSSRFRSARSYFAVWLIARVAFQAKLTD